MSDFKLILPSAVTNLFTNPEFGNGLTDWTAGILITATLQSDDRAFGLYSVEITLATGDALYQTLVDANIQYTLSCYVKISDGVAIATGTRAYFDTTAVAWDTITAVGNGWYRCEYTGTGGVNTGRYGIYVIGGEFYVDGFQLESGDEASTYCDGEQPGCVWNGVRHASTSTRSGVSRAGGLIDDLEDDLHFDISSFAGAQIAPQNVNIDSFSTLPGGALNSIKIRERIMTMTGVVRGTSLENMHANKQELVSAILPDSYPQTAEGYQPVRLRYTGSSVDKEIEAHYQSRMEGNLSAREPCAWERIAIRWACPDPFWYDVLDNAQLLDPYDTPTFRYIAARLRATGQWDDTGLAANPTANGTIYAILPASDGTIYVGGNFTGMNGVAGRDYVANYDPATDTWTTVGGASDFNGIVYALAEGPDGTIYAGGAFLNCAGVAAADGIAQWDGANWTAVGANSVVTVYAFQFGQDGTLYIGGSFANMGGVANADNLAYWDGAAYGAVGAVAGPNGAVNSLSMRTSGYIILTGAFTTVGGVNADRIAGWSGATFFELAGGLNAAGNAVVVRDDNTLYVGGDFTQDGDGNTLNYIAKQVSGTGVFEQLDGGMDAAVESLALGPDGTLYAGGQFGVAGSLTLVSDRVARWNNASWLPLDIDLPGGGVVVYAMATTNPDPVIPNNYDVYIGFNATGAGACNGTATAANNGTEKAYPQIIIERTGTGDTWLQTLRNETTGKELIFNNYYMLEDEILTITLAPTGKTIVSNFFGSRPDALLPGSDFGEWALLPGDNQITLYVVRVAPAALTPWLQWKDPYNGVD